jgi:hypothetical protein
MGGMVCGGVSPVGIIDPSVASLASERHKFFFDTDRRIFVLDADRRIFVLDVDRRAFTNHHDK